MFDDYLWNSYVYLTTFSNVKYQDLSAKINLSKIKYLQNQRQSLKYLCNNNLIGFLQKPDKLSVILQEESHTVGLLSIQIEKYEITD